MSFELPSSLAASTPSTTLLSPAAASPAATANDPDAQAVAQLKAAFERDSGAGRDAFALLDLSTNVSLFGVTFAQTENPHFSVADLYLKTQSAGVRVWTLPAVQWEPVLTLPGDDPNDPNFPSPLTFDDCGGQTELAANSVALVPIAPRPAIDAMLAGYNRFETPRQ